MSRKTSNVFRTSFLTIDGTFDPNNSELFFRPLQAPLNTRNNPFLNNGADRFYSLSCAQSNDPSLRINKYDASGTLLDYGYLYDTQFNPLPPGFLLIVAGGIGPNTLAYSENGISWIPSQTGLADACLTIAYDGFTWLAGGIDNTGHITIVYSSNGRTWLPNIGGSSLFTHSCNALATNGSVWIGGGRNNDAVIGFSYDGLTWNTATTESIFTGTNITVIAYNELLWLAGASTYNNGPVPNALARSSEGIHWSAIDLTGIPIDNVYTICWNGALWVVGGDVNGVSAIIYSTDSYAWFSSTSATVIPSSIRALAWNGLQFVAGGYDSAGLGRTLAYSDDGITWTASTTTNMFPFYCNGVTWDGNRWEAVGIKAYNGEFSIATSLDGLTWLGNLSGTNALPQGYAVAVNSRLPFVGSKTPNPSATAPLSLISGINPQFGSAIGYSTDGISWKFLPNASVVARGNGIAGISWNGTLWIAGVSPLGPPKYARGYPTLIYSYDGIVWNVSTSAFIEANGLLSADTTSWGLGKFIISGGFYDQFGTPRKCVIESSDGINWSRINSLTTPNNNGLLYGAFTNYTVWLLLGSRFGAPYPEYLASLLYSLDNGATWQASASAVSVFPVGSSRTAWNGRLWSMMSIGSPSIIGFSPDGINWTSGTLTNLTYMQNVTGLVSNGSMFLLCGGFLTGGVNSKPIMYSYDGIDYYPVSYIPDSVDLYILSVNWTGTLWTATGSKYGIGVVLYSYNGVYWYPSYRGSEYINTEYGSFSATNRINPTAGNTLPPAVINQGLTPPNGSMIYTDKANNLYKSSILNVDETNGIVGINQTAQSYTDLAGTSIQAALELSGGSITINTFKQENIAGLFLTANNVSAGSGGRIEMKDKVTNKGWRIDNNANTSNHLQITAYSANVGTLCMDFDGSGNVGIGSVTDSAYKLKVDGNMLVTSNSTVSGTGKLFMIDHPDPALHNTHFLRHSCVEGPSRGDTLYRWTITTIHKTAQQSLPSYSPYLNENWQFIVKATNSFGRGYVTLSPCETFFTLTTNEDGTYSILGIATRKDEASRSFVLEPVK